MTTMIPQDVQMLDWNDTPQVTNTFQLLQWKYAIKIEMETGMKVQGGRSVIAHVRKFLSAPPKSKFSNQELYDHVSDSLDDIQAQIQALNAAERAIAARKRITDRIANPNDQPSPAIQRNHYPE